MGASRRLGQAVLATEPRRASGARCAAAVIPMPISGGIRGGMRAFADATEELRRLVSLVRAPSFLTTPARLRRRAVGRGPLPSPRSCYAPIVPRRRVSGAGAPFPGKTGQRGSRLAHRNESIEKSTGMTRSVPAMISMSSIGSVTVAARSKPSTRVASP